MPLQPVHLPQPPDQMYRSPRNSIAVDPTRLLYRFEADLPLLAAGGAAFVTSIGSGQRRSAWSEVAGRVPAPAAPGRRGT
jgi:hypothetical protein